MSSLPWPLPALLSWAAAWGLAWALRGASAPLWATLVLPTALGACLALWPAVAATTWRRVFVAAGFPLSVLALGQGGGLPAWVWLAPLGLLLLAYPMRSWRDAPVFPTPKGALRALPEYVRLPPDAHILDAGCGMGDGLQALREAYPQARLSGVEWSWVWWAVCALRCPWAKVRRGDMWATDWSGYDLVYLFQRPETMPRAWAKALQTMKPGSWLVSLEFAATDAQGRGVHPNASFTLAGGRPIWVYRLPRAVHGESRASTLSA
ncbi:MAG: class I SAM-dependent methyltransferase [Burkholderiales bacterium]|nr:class I SAM-dependent methyltransferase [Burkholderiales bacterium]